MNKKYAMLLMNQHYCPEEHRACFVAGGVETHILTVRDGEEAVSLARELADQGFGAIEVCGAFGQELARRMYDAADHRLTVGYVVCPPDQEAANSRFWGES